MATTDDCVVKCKLFEGNSLYLRQIKDGSFVQCWFYMNGAQTTHKIATVKACDLKPLLRFLMGRLNDSLPFEPGPNALMYCRWYGEDLYFTWPDLKLEGDVFKPGRAVFPSEKDLEALVSFLSNAYAARSEHSDNAAPVFGLQ